MLAMFRSGAGRSGQAAAATRAHSGAGAALSPVLPQSNRLPSLTHKHQLLKQQQNHGQLGPPGPNKGRPVAARFGTGPPSPLDTLEGVIQAERSIYDVHLPVFQGWQPGVAEPASPGHAGGADSVASPSPSQADQQPEKQSDQQPPEQQQLVVDQCFVTHPGSLTCTSASVVHNPNSDTVVLSIRASVRKTEATATSNMLDLEELGWLALKNTATQRAGAQRSASGEHDERHGSILRMLSTGTVTDAVKSTNGFGHISYVVTLQDNKTRQKCKALFKPTLEGDGDGW
jgi:hypothetical protein